MVQGLGVTEVQPGSPAEEAGLQPGDFIVRVNGHPVRTGAGLRAAVQSARRGGMLNLVIQRGNMRSLVTVTIP